MSDASEIVNSVLGALCLYRRSNGSVVCKTANIIVNKNVPVNNDYGVLAGYRVEASILKAEVPKIIIGDQFTDDENDTWRVTLMMKETTSKWYVDVVRM